MQPILHQPLLSFEHQLRNLGLSASPDGRRLGEAIMRKSRTGSDGWRCAACGLLMPAEEVQLMWDLSPERGGPLALENVVGVCVHCLVIKGLLTADELRHFLTGLEAVAPPFDLTMRLVLHAGWEGWARALRLNPEAVYRGRCFDDDGLPRRTSNNPAQGKTCRSR